MNLAAVSTAWMIVAGVNTARCVLTFSRFHLSFLFINPTYKLHSL